MSDTQPAASQKIAAEALGTFVLVFFGVGAAIVSSGDYAATGLAFGLAVLVMAYAVGHISGGHFNPAVTLGAAVSGRLPWREVGRYVLAQVAGAILAGLFLFVLLQGFEGYEAKGHIGANSFGDNGTGFAWWSAFLVELLATAIFLYVILAVTDERNPSKAAAPVAIGLALTLIHFATMGLTGTSVNPARSIGVGLFGGGEAVLELWLFILAPLLGAAIAGLTYASIFGRDREPVAGSGLRLHLPKKAAAAAPAGAYDQTQQLQPEEWVAQVQEQYPGWAWDAENQQWVPTQDQPAQDQPTQSQPTQHQAPQDQPPQDPQTDRP